MISGLKDIEHMQITALCAVPVSILNSVRERRRDSIAANNPIDFFYLPRFRMILLDWLIGFLLALYSSLIWCFKNRTGERYVISDASNLNHPISLAVKLAAMLFGVKAAAIVMNTSDDERTGVKHTGLSREAPSSRGERAVGDWLMNSYDSYVILSDDDERLRYQHKPHIIIDGLVDLKLNSVLHTVGEKFEEMIIVCIDKFDEGSGVENLLNAFLHVECAEARLWLFGSRELSQQIALYEASDDRICYCGEIPHNKLLDIAGKASLLVSTAPCDKTWNKCFSMMTYMEYMVTGTPLLTTCLSGMPLEYTKHVYGIDDESVAGIARKLNELLAMDRREIHHYGLQARAYIFQHKNNKIQSSRVYSLMLSSSAGQ